MKFIQKCLVSCAALLPLAPLVSLTLMSTPVQAQQYSSRTSTPRIDGFNVDEVRSLTPGTELNFTVYGTPGGTATLRIGGAVRNLTLSEDEPGQYEGTYTISSRDALTARSAVTANLRVGNLVASSVLAESLQAGPGRRAQGEQPGPLPRIERFDVEPSAELTGGNDLKFILLGTPGGKAEVTIAGTNGKFFLPEIRRGEYQGSYLIKRRDRVMSDSAVTVSLLVGNRITNATLGQPLMTATAPVRQQRACTNCGTVEAVNVVEVKGEGGYLGTIGGGVVGALLGSQVGGGNGRTAAQIAGALGGAYAGNQLEGNSRKTTHYEVLVRLQNGASQTVTMDADPRLTIGERVRVTDGVLTRDQ